MICVNGEYFNLKVIRKNNRNVYLRISGDTITITCPRYVTKEDIIKFINEKSDWISNTLQKTKQRQTTSKLTINDQIYYLGKQYRFLVFAGKPGISILENMIVVYCKDGSMENALKVFYKETSKTLLKMIDDIQPKYLKIISDYGYKQIPEYKVRLLKSMWGVNYTKKNCITINERLIHFDPICLEAILWHELLHFIIPNHSKRYHEVLEYHMPRYKETVKSIY